MRCSGLLARSTTRCQRPALPRHAAAAVPSALAAHAHGTAAVQPSSVTPVPSCPARRLLALAAGPYLPTPVAGRTGVRTYAAAPADAPAAKPDDRIPVTVSERPGGRRGDGYGAYYCNALGTVPQAAACGWAELTCTAWWLRSGVQLAYGGQGWACGGRRAGWRGIQAVKRSWV